MGAILRHVLTLPDGRELATSSIKQFHVVREHANGTLVRVTSSDVRTRALAAWRDLRRAHQRVWVLDAINGDIVRDEHDPYVGTPS